MNELKPVAWHTEDHTDDFSATTYDEGLAEHWKKKGWPVTPMFYAILDTHRVVSVERLRGIQSAFYNAADDVLGWGAYADAYFQDKHGLEDQALVYKLMAESLSAIIDNKEAK